MYKVIKRTFDFLSSLALLVAISPLFVILALLVRVRLGSPILFRQIRSGKDMKPFGMMKFRTMTNDKDENGDLLPDEMRLTKMGKWLRSTSLDELPELLNIIKGDMSVIGPRPLPVVYDEYYTKEEKNRFLVRGGLITPDSIDLSPIISWDRQLEYESDYAKNLCFKKDWDIFIGVFHILFSRTKTDYGKYVRPALHEERKMKLQ